MKCKGCGKGIRHSQKGFTWREEQLCSKCYMEKNNLQKVKIIREGKRYNVVYISNVIFVIR